MQPYGGDPSSGTVRAFGSGDDPGRWIFRGDVGLGTVSAFGSECNTWADVCTLAFQGAMDEFLLEVAEIRPAVVFWNSLFPGEECANVIVSVQGDVPMSPVLQVTDKGVAMIPPVTDQHVQRTVSRSVSWGAYSVRLCLLYPDGTEDLQDLRGGSVDSQRLDHWRTVSWDPGIADSRAISVCYDCLCLMALFRAVMFVWTGPDEGNCHSIAWEERYLPRLHPPCVVDRLFGYTTEIKVPGIVLMLNKDRNNSARRCACMRGTSLGVFSAGRISLPLIGCSACVGGSVDCSDWPRSDCMVDFSPRGVWIGYIRPGLWDASLIDAAPVTGSLVSSALFDCLDVYCAAGFTSYWTFCSTECVLLAGFELFLRWVSECRMMATNGAALAEERAGIKFGVKLYIPWDAPEAVLDISSKGVVPLRNIPDVIGQVVCSKAEISAVCEFWSRIVVAWIGIFMTLR